MLKRTLLAAGMVAAIGLGTSAMALAHGPDATCTNQPCGWHQGWHMGPGMMGQGQMGQGMGQGQMGPGMMGQGQMGQGMGQGQMGPGMVQPLRQDLSAADVQHMMEHRLAWQGNPNVKVGKVEDKDDDTIVAEIVTQDGSLVQRLEVDRHTGWMRPTQ